MLPRFAQIAIEGCCHGELDNIYATMQLLEQKEGTKIDLLICCGDFQVSRSALKPSTRPTQSPQRCDYTTHCPAHDLTLNLPIASWQAALIKSSKARMLAH